MKKIFISLFLSALAFSLTQAQVKETRNHDNFSEISFGVSGKLYVKQGNTFSVVIEGNKDVLEDIETRVEGGRLIVRHDSWISIRDSRITAWVTLPEIEGLSVSGSGHVYCEGPVKSEDIELKVSGSGNLDMAELKAEAVEVSISGYGNVELAGNGASSIEVSISGSGSMDAEEFRTGSAEVSISGSGRCRVWVENSLESRISGSGSVYYRGDPNIDSRSSGSGKLRKL